MMIWLLLLIIFIIALQFTPDVKKEDYPLCVKIFQEHMQAQREQEIINKIKAEEQLAEYKVKYPERFVTK